MSIFNYFRKPRDNQFQNKQELLSSLLVMAWMVEARDPYTGGHLWRVSNFAKLLAEASSLPETDVARISLGGFLHDLGKIGVPDNILGKRDRLTDEEYDVMKTHPSSGWRALVGHPLSWVVEPSVRHHHETPDGNGYPLGLKGEEIPIDARIVGICDAFDAMTSTRPYRKGMPVEKALSIIENNLGTQFDKELGQRFINLGKKGALDHIVGHSDDGIPLYECMMCGPTLVVGKQAKDNESVYCPACKGEHVVNRQNGKIDLTPTGKMGKPEDVLPEPDTDLIERIIQRSLLPLFNVDFEKG